jgi:hypothetical protein
VAQKRGKAETRDIVQRNETRVTFIDRERLNVRLTFERNVGQASFADHQEGAGAAILINAHDGEAPWFMVRADVEELRDWLGGVLAATEVKR